MEKIRLHFEKTGPASYISHLDLQRAMARAVRKSGLPAWYSMGCNPHIYMTFALPLPIMQESVCETVDFKTERENDDFGKYVPLLSDALPKGIEAKAIRRPAHEAEEIAGAQYSFSCPEACAGAFAKAVDAYNRAETVNVVKKTKKSESVVDLKTHVKELEVVSRTMYKVVLPAGSSFNLNPALLLSAVLGGEANGEAEDSQAVGIYDIIVRRECVFTAAGAVFD